MSAALSILCAMALGSAAMAAPAEPEPKAVAPAATKTTPAPRGGSEATGHGTSPAVGDAAAPKPPAVETAPTPTVPAGPTALDVVLPSGLRVIAARDDTLPVAAVVLAIETGTEDDAPDRPGLVHAMAYHLLQGNREIAPGGAARIIHDSGGVTGMAIGPGQVRYETLVPRSHLDDAIWIETQRLRAPTVTEPLWKETLTFARRNGSRKLPVPRAALAAAHDAPGLLHDGRKVSPSLESLAPTAIGIQIANRFSYTRATLVVVSPLPPDQIVGKVGVRMGDLPAADRIAGVRYTPHKTEPEPRRIELAGQKGNAFVWPLPPRPAARHLAGAWCSAINRMRRVSGEPRRARSRCAIDLDPRRAIVVVRTGGVDDPVAFLRARFERLATTDARLVELERARAAQRLEVALDAPLPLARALAAGDPDRPPPADPKANVLSRPIAELTGAAALTDAAHPSADTGHLSELGAAVRLVGESAQ